MGRPEPWAVPVGANLVTYNITSFATSYAPSVVTLPPLATSIPCPSTTALLPNITYQTEYTSVGLACRKAKAPPELKLPQIL